MLTTLEIQNPQSGILSLPMSDYSGGYLVRDISGLDPVKATLVSSSMAQIDGAQFQTSRRDTRNVTMKLALKPDYSVTNVAALRTALYSYVLPKSTVTLNFYVDGALYATTTGIVESMENSMFSSDPEVDISIICYDPDFYAPSAVTVNGNTVTGTTTTTINYTGTTDAGIIFTLNVDQSITGFQLYNTRPDNTVQLLDVEGSFIAGDVVTVTTIPGSKSVILNRSNTDSNVLYYLVSTSKWTSLQNGDNLFRAVCTSAVTAIPYSVVYTPKYGGI